MLKTRLSVRPSYLLQEFQGQSGHLICHSGIQHPRTVGGGTPQAPPSLVASYLQRSSLSPAVDEGLWRLASAREREGPTSRWTAVSAANTGIAKAVARRSRQGGPRLPGFRGESYPGPAHALPRGCLQTLPLPGVARQAPWKGKRGQQLGPEGQSRVLAGGQSQPHHTRSPP